MNKETLKELIQIEFDRCLTLLQFKQEVFRLIDLYESDKQFIPTPGFVVDCGIPDEVSYGSICSCNPANGGSGMCGCVMSNKMVPNPKKYGYPKTNTLISTDTELQNPYSPTAKWITNQP